MPESITRSGPLTDSRVMILLESDFYEPEILYYQRRFAEEGCEAHFRTRLWGQSTLTFAGHEEESEVEVMDATIRRTQDVEVLEKDKEANA